MVAGSILPVALYKKKLYFLFGKENPLERDAKGWSDFGGGVEKDETPFDTAMREGGEELTGFLGDGKQIREWVKQVGYYPITVDTYHVHVIPTGYDPKLPVYYNNNHKFLWERMDQKMLKKTKLFEKIEIGWFTEEDMRNRRREFRGFYREIVDQILVHSKEIRAMIVV